MIADDTSVTLRAAVLQTLRMFEADEQGIMKDAAIGATGVANRIALISGDWDLGNAFAKLGGEFRYLR